MPYEPAAEYYLGVEPWMVLILLPLCFTILLLIFTAAERVVTASQERRDVQKSLSDESLRLINPAVEWNGRIVQ